MTKFKKIEIEYENESLIVERTGDKVCITQVIETGGGNCDVNQLSILLEQVPNLIDILDMVTIPHSNI